MASVTEITNRDALRAAFDRQRAAWNGEGAPTLEARKESLRKLRSSIVRNATEIQAAISADFGHRAAQETGLLEIGPSLSAIAHALKHLHRWMRPERRPVSINFKPGRAWIEYQPLGVIGAISPWNYPLFLAVTPLADALAAGNRVMLKPSELTPEFVRVLQRMISEAFSPDQVAVVSGGAELAAEFSALPFDHLMFTGSAGVARKVMQAAAQNLTPVTLELGGKSPAIVAGDYPLEKAARSIVHGKLLNAGQTCIAPDYVLVPENIAEQFVLALMEEIGGSYPEIANNPDYSAIINDRHRKRLRALLDSTEKTGIRVLRHGNGDEARMEPVIVIDPPHDSAIMQEEIFGPILPVCTYKTVEDAIGIVNAHSRPLALYLFTNDKTVERKILAGTTSGGVTLNGTLLHIAQEELPFGGVGESGMGAYHGETGFRRFSHAKSVFKTGPVNFFELLRPPYGRLANLAVRYFTRR